MFNLTSDFKYAASQIQRDGSGLALWSPGPRCHFFPEHQDVVPRGNVCVCRCVCEGSWESAVQDSTSFVFFSKQMLGCINDF